MLEFKVGDVLYCDLNEESVVLITEIAPYGNNIAYFYKVLWKNNHYANLGFFVNDSIRALRSKVINNSSWKLLYG